MKIGILTFHRSINNGAVMQCYSLSKKLCQMLPNDIVEVIDYHMPKVDNFYYTTYREYFRVKSPIVKIKRFCALLTDPQKIKWKAKRQKAFEDSLFQLPLSEHKIMDNGQEQLIEYINQRYDIVIAGSDAIWNYKMRGYPNPYFLSNKIHCHKLSYAASCYGMNYEKLPESEKGEIARVLNGYDFLGIRDDETKEFLNTVGCNLAAFHTCDPTVFLDINDLPIDVDQLKKKLISKGYRFERDTIAIMGSEKMCNMVREMYGEKYQIVALYNRCRNADVNLYDLTPYEWAYAFRYFKIVFTTFFHGTLLSLRNGTPVICIALETEYSDTHTTKVADFLKRVGLYECYFNTDYQGTNYDKIKSKADEFMSGDYSDMILDKMDQEAASFDIFAKALMSISELHKKGKGGNTYD